MRSIVTILMVGWAGVLCSGCAAKPAAAETRVPAASKYYMVIFASQTEPPRPRTSHTFATFVKVNDAAGANQETPPQSHTISWMPATGNIVIVRLAPEAGKNFTLDESLRWAAELNSRVTAWGPFEIQKTLFDSALQQIERLNSGQMSYKAVDSRFRGGTVVNCIHAVSDIAPEDGLLATGTAHGEAASAAVVSHLQRWIINPEETHPEIAGQLGLSKDMVRFQSVPKAERIAP